MAATAIRTTRIIPKRLLIQQEEITAPQIVVAAYARVSTEKEEQEDSFERQVQHYTEYINAHKEWKFGGIYADPGISGTKAEARPDFMRMINDCRAGKINRILVKSISRFARNTVDALTYIRELRDLGISVQFESENIDTLTPGGEVLLTILAAIAEQESRTISSNIKWAWARKAQRGEVTINTGLMLGYVKEKDGSYSINEDEAWIIRRIFREYVSGVSTTQICRGLEADGIKTKLGKNKWYPTAVMKMLQNEKYAGNAILGKTYKPDVMSKKRYKNDGEAAPMYFAEGTHPAIVDQDLFDLAQNIMAHRETNGTTAVGTSKYTGKYPFSGILICSKCHHSLRRHVNRVCTGEKVARWGCTNKLSNGKAECNLRDIREDMLERTYIAAVKDLAGDIDSIIDAVSSSAGLVLAPQTSQTLRDIDGQILEIQTEVMELHKVRQIGNLSMDEYNRNIGEYSDRIHALEEKKTELQNSQSRYALVQNWLDNFKEFVHQGSFDGMNKAMMVRALVDEIIVYDNEIEIHFKCGVIRRKKYVK